jgi:hypothetical protein
MRSHIPSNYPSEQAAVARINDLEKQLGKTPTKFGNRAVYINDLWEDIGDLEKELDAKKQADAQANLDRILSETSTAQEPGTKAEAPGPTAPERPPLVATGVTRAVAAVQGVKTAHDEPKPLYGVARSIAALNKK